MICEKDKYSLNTIINYCETIKNDLASIDSNEATFKEDYFIQRVIAFDLQQIGEAVGRLSDDFISEYNKVPWRDIKDLRNRVIHAYDSIDLGTVWYTCIDDMPKLLEYLKTIV